MFFSIEGGDGTGKSTQVQLLSQWLQAVGQEVVACRDPGSTRLGEAVRQIVLHGHDLEIGRCSEMLLYMAARAQLTEEVIRPALASGKIVISDRYLLSNVVYQGYGGGLDIASLWQVGLVATAGLLPDLTIVLDLPTEKAASRLKGTPDRMEQQGDAFHRRVRQGFLDEAARQPDRIATVSAEAPIEAVQESIRRVAAARLREGGVVV